MRYLGTRRRFSDLDTHQAMKPYYQDEHVTLYHGDCREILPQLGVQVGCVIADPPYGETSLAWDRWPDGWPTVVAALTPSMWCFGSLRMFLERREQFASWKLSQDLVWSKGRGSGPVFDRFRRTHESVALWYHGSWNDLHKEQQRTPHFGRRGEVATHPHGEIDPHRTQMLTGRATWRDDGTRTVESVITCRNMHRRGLHPTEKPLGILSPLISYTCPSGGVVLDPFAGSGSTLLAAKLLGYNTIGVEIDERYCQITTKRLSQGAFDFGLA